MSHKFSRLVRLSALGLLYLLAILCLALPSFNAHASSEQSLLGTDTPTAIVPTVTVSIPTPTPTVGMTPTPTVGVTPTPVVTPTPTPIPSPSPAASPSPSPSVTVSPSPTATVTAQPSTNPSGGSPGQTGIVLTVALGIIGLILVVVGIVLYSVYARQQRSVEGR